MRELHRSQFFTITHEPLARLLRVWRSPEPFRSIEEIDACFRAMERDLATVPRARCGVLLDVRDGPMRNDPAFEQTMARHRARLFDGLAATAVLVRTAAGRLQLARLAREERIDRPVFHDEAAARKYLAEATTTTKG